MTTLRARAHAAAWPPEKKAAILAALLRFDEFHEREVRAARQLTESATEGVRAARMQVRALLVFFVLFSSLSRRGSGCVVANARMVYDTIR